MLKKSIILLTIIMIMATLGCVEHETVVVTGNSDSNGQDVVNNQQTTVINNTQTTVVNTETNVETNTENNIESNTTTYITVDGEEEISNSTIIDFYADDTHGQCPLHTNFHSIVPKNITVEKYQWIFEPVENKDYQSFHPKTAVHTFKGSDVYDVTLIVTDENGTEYRCVKENYITVY